MMKETKPSAKQRVLRTLSDGQKHHAAELTIKCFTSDPRSIIRDLREAGFIIRDEWATTAAGARYKLYWLISDKTTHDDEQ